jgi:hypothetical protein
MDDLTRRAFTAYFRTSQAHHLGVTDQPANTAGVVHHDGKTYVELHNARGTLAVYRVRTSGALKRLKRWPAEVAER